MHKETMLSTSDAFFITIFPFAVSYISVSDVLFRELLESRFQLLFVFGSEYLFFSYACRYLGVNLSHMLVQVTLVVGYLLKRNILEIVVDYCVDYDYLIFYRNGRILSLL